MKLRIVLAATAVVLALGGSRPAAHANVSTVVGAYVAGWNMAGGPAGTDFSRATSLQAYGQNGYFTPATNAAALCQGYWAYFNDPAAVTLPTSTGPTQDCALQTGWNLIGNPFSGYAELPAGTTGYWWNPDRGAYDNVTTVPPGASVWLYAFSASSVTLTFVPAITRVPSTLEIDFLVTSGPYTVHVGDSVKLLLPLSVPFGAVADPQYLRLETAGQSGDLSCVGNSCAVSLINQFWIWHALQPGTTTITVSPRCLNASPPCALPSFELVIDILP